MELTHRFSDALIYAADLHRGQVRKGTDTPYVSHLLAVCSLVLEHGGSEDEAIAALLHDGPEDQGGEATLTAIREHFGANVANIVAGCSDTLEQEKPDWGTRKRAYVEHIKTAPPPVMLVSLCDKLHNARTILADYRVRGESLWERFRAKADGTMWYYVALVDVFRDAGACAALVDELDRTIAELKRLRKAKTIEELIKERPELFDYEDCRPGKDYYIDDLSEVKPGYPEA